MQNTYTEPAKTQDRSTVFLGSADPDFALGPQRLRQTVALQSLLFTKPVIQDNFLLSGQALQLMQSDSLLTDLLSSGVLAVALRDTVQGMYPLARSQAKATNDGKFVPFKGDSLSLYESTEFEQHSAIVDRALHTGANALRWTPKLLGLGFRNKMAASVDAAEFGLSQAESFDIWDKVESLAKAQRRDTHSCSDYFTVADSFLAEAKRASAKAWARSYYLTNIPDLLNFSSWQPSHLLDRHQRRNELTKLPWRRGEEDIMLSTGLFNATFLSHVSIADILALRKEDSFRRLQKAFQAGDTNRVQRDFDNYKRVVHDYAPSVIPGAAKEVARLEFWIETGRTIDKYGTPIISSVAAAAALALLAQPVGVALIASAGLAGAVSYGIRRPTEWATELAIEKKRSIIEAAKAGLDGSRFKGDVFSLLDILHGGSPSGNIEA